MEKAKKIIALVLCAVLLVGATIAGTMAYLTDTKAVTNTFTVGKVAITLDETKVDEYGVAVTGEEAGRTAAGNAYKLVPGRTYTKDPIVHVKNDSEPSYIFVKIDNGIADLEDTTTIANQITTTNGWTQLTDATNNPVDNVYYKDWAKDANATGDYTDLPVFGNFKLKNDADVTSLGDTNGDGTVDATITVTAYAIQKAGFEFNVYGAWQAVSTSATNP